MRVIDCLRMFFSVPFQEFFPLRSLCKTDYKAEAVKGETKIAVLRVLQIGWLVHAALGALLLMALNRKGKKVTFMTFLRHFRR